MSCRSIKLLVCLAVSFSLVFSAGAKVVAAISTLKGAVMIKPLGSRKYIPAYKGQMLKSGEWLKTKDGVFVAIVFLDGSNIKIQQETEVKISSYRMTAKELKTNLEMTKGQAWSNVADQGSGGQFTIKTPTAVASVKGTEFDLAYDLENDETTLIVLAGEVEFAGELGTILAGAMESSKDGGPSVKISDEEIPSWQKNTDPNWAFKLKTDKIAKQQVDKIIKVNIQIINAKNKKFDNSFTGEASVVSQSNNLMVSSDGSSWSSSADISINSGRGVAHVKSSRQGEFEIIVNADNAESKSLSFKYYQTKSQKRASQDKLSAFAQKKGKGKLSEMIKNKVLMKSQVTMGSGNIGDVLQKLETGEYELEGEPDIVDNGDGTITVKLKVKPR